MMCWRAHRAVVAGVPALLAAAAIAAGVASAGSGKLPAGIAVVGDSVPEPLEGRVGDAVRGRRIVLDRESGNCLICHQLPASGEPFQGDLAPSLAGVGARFSKGQLRLRVIDQSQLNPATLMPPYHRVDGLVRVAPRYKDQTVLSAAEVEDVVAFLATLTGP